LLNHGEPEGEEKSSERSEKIGKAQAREAEADEKQVSGDANGGNGNVVYDCKRAVIHDAAIPSRIDVARFGSGDVVNAKRQCRNHDSGERQESKDISHRIRGSEESILFRF
jgi:hypothetical protein